MRTNKILHLLADLRVSATLILCFALDTLLGTLMQAQYGLWAAQQAFFHSWIAQIPLADGRYIPFIGVPTLGVLAVINLSAAIMVKLRWTWRNTGLILLHIGLISLLLSAGASWFATQSGVLELGPQEQAHHYESNDQWELVLRVATDSGTAQWILPLHGLAPQDSLAMGPHLPSAVVRAYYPHGMLVGAQQDAAPLPQTSEPESYTPVLNLDVLYADSLIHVGVSAESAPWVPSPGTLLYLRKENRNLPFTAQMLRFERVMHPGTGIAASYTTWLKITTPQDTREVRISMNEPLRIGSYTLFQSSWKPGTNGASDRSILAVVENPWRNAPYASTLIIALGLLMHTLSHIRQAFRAKHTVALIALALFSLNTPVHAIDAPAQLMRLPIQIDGRVKPLDSYARQLLLQISGRSRGAANWFTQVLLGNGTQDSVAIFLIENPATRDALGLAGKPRDRYSWQQIEPLGPKLDTLARAALLFKPNDRTVAQRDLLRVADSWNRYYAIRHAFDPIRTWHPARPAPFPTPTPVQDFYSFVTHSSAIAITLDSLLRIPESLIDSQAQVRLDWVNQTMQESHFWSSIEFPVWLNPDSSNALWLSPGAELLVRGPDSQLLTFMDHWRTIHLAWLAQDKLGVETAALSLETQIIQQSLTNTVIRPQAWRTEYLYNRIEPFFRAMLLYGLAALFALLYMWQPSPKWHYISYGLIASGWALQLAGMVMRSYITLRPPATNLYETFVFSSACAVVLALLAGRWRGLKATPLVVAASGASLLMIARRYGMEGDTMPVLAAVLDSNFWLTIHVLSITVGYASVLVGGLYAHLHLWLRWRHGAQSTQELAAFRTLRLLMMIGLFFTFLGTLLGAIWADQSWGRFWGWDPKENGALIIILWVAFLFHAMPCGWMQRRGFALGSVFAIQTVLFAWFGVNLMGVGLHSYGFTEGAFQGLITFAVVELLYVIWILTRRRT